MQWAVQASHIVPRRKKGKCLWSTGRYLGQLLQPGASAIEMHVSEDLQRSGSGLEGRTRNHPPCFVHSAHCKLKDSALVTQSSLANQGMQANMAVRSSAGLFRLQAAGVSM